MWVAAILDVKGSIVRKNNQTRATSQLVLGVESKNLKVTHKLSSLTGIKAEVRKSPAEKSETKSRRPCSEHCPEPHAHQHPKFHLLPQVGFWAITGASAGIVIYNVLPYLQNTASFKLMMMEVLHQTVLQNRGSGMTRNAIIRLVNLGWALPPELMERVTREEIRDIADAVVQNQSIPLASTKVGGTIDINGQAVTEAWARQDLENMQQYLIAHAAKGWKFAGDVMIADGSHHPVFTLSEAL